MSDVGTVLDDGALRLEFLVTGASSEGALHEMRAIYAPDSPLAIAHLHPAQDERFEVLEGELLFVVDGDERRVHAAETIHIPRGSVHQVRNPGAVPAIAVWQTRPALRTGEFLVAAAAARAGGDLDALLEVVAAYDDVFVLADQPGG